MPQYHAAVRRNAMTPPLPTPNYHLLKFAASLYQAHNNDAAGATRSERSEQSGIMSHGRAVSASLCISQ